MTLNCGQQKSNHVLQDAESVHASGWESTRTSNEIPASGDTGAATNNEIVLIDDYPTNGPHQNELDNVYDKYDYMDHQGYSQFNVDEGEQNPTCMILSQLLIRLVHPSVGSIPTTTGHLTLIRLIQSPVVYSSGLKAHFV